MVTDLASRTLLSSRQRFGGRCGFSRRIRMDCCCDMLRQLDCVIAAGREAGKKLR